VAIDRERVLAAAQKYVEKKRYDRAVIEYQRVIQEDPNDARTLLKIGDLQSKMEAYADAVATYERVGKFYSSQGFALKAIAVYKQIREIIAKHLPQLEDRYAHITPKLAELYQQLGLTSDALAAFDEVATRLQRQSRDQDAIEVFRKIVELDPTNPLPHLRLAEALSRVKDVDSAVHEFGTAAQQLAKLGRRDDALKVLERLLHHKADPTHARIAAEQYLARTSPNDGLQALAKLQICFQANPRDLDTLGLLAKAFNQIGQAAKAIEVQKEMARIARDAGKHELFREILTRLMKLAPNDEGVRALTMVSSAPAPPSVGFPAPAARQPAPEPVVSRTNDERRDPYAEAGDSFDDEYEDVGDSDIEAEELEEQPLDDGQQGGIPVEHGYGVAEEVGEPAPSASEQERVMRVLADAASFRRARVPAKAIETLRIGLEMSPRSIEVHEMLRDVLLEAGRADEAVAVMLDLAGLEIDGLDGEGAARTLQDVLAIDPTNVRATEMLHELGYELVEEPASSVPEIAPDEYDAQASLPAGDSYDPEGPLPSYDLEEIGPEDVSMRSYSEPSIRERARASLESIDDPFGEAPLPSFPLEGPGESDVDLSPAADRTDGNEDYASSRVPAKRSGGPGGAPELESALEEAEFFASRGLFEDARTILQEQLVRLPSHPLLRERLQELEAQERGIQGGSGTRPSPSAEAEARDPEDRAFDIAESLGGLDPAELVPEAGFGAAIEQVDVEEVFAKFKEGVAQQIGVDDAQSHYDLGVAYKEMALLDDAIREFDTAARDPRRACVCHSMIGMIQIEQGNLNEAIDSFTRGLQAPDCTKDQEAALSYEIGAAYEVKRVNKQALEYFQRTARLAPNFRDVQERIRRLQTAQPKQPMRAAVGADDEFDRAFEDIMGGGKQT
jgi:tetratricopeptide (TPR) repeat protein